MAGRPALIAHDFLARRDRNDFVGTQARGLGHRRALLGL